MLEGLLHDQRSSDSSSEDIFSKHIEPITFITKFSTIIDLREIESLYTPASGGSRDDALVRHPTRAKSTQTDQSNYAASNRSSGSPQSNEMVDDPTNDAISRAQATSPGSSTEKPPVVTTKSLCTNAHKGCGFSTVHEVLIISHASNSYVRCRCRLRKVRYSQTQYFDPEPVEYEAIQMQVFEERLFIRNRPCHSRYGAKGARSSQSRLPTCQAWNHATTICKYKDGPVVDESSLVKKKTISCSCEASGCLSKFADQKGAISHARENCRYSSATPTSAIDDRGTTRNKANASIKCKNEVYGCPRMGVSQKSIRKHERTTCKYDSGAAATRRPRNRPKASFKCKHGGCPHTSISQRAVRRHKDSYWKYRFRAAVAQEDVLMSDDRDSNSQREEDSA